MAYPKLKPRVVAFFALIILASGGVWLWSQNKSDNKTQSANTNNGTGSSGSNKTNPSTTPSTANGATINTQAFSYDMPAGWAAIPSETSTAKGSVSSILKASVPTATFDIAVESASTTPSNITSLKNDTLNTIKKFPGYVLVSNSSIKIGGQDGQRYIYSRTVSGGKTRQELVVTIYKKQAYSLLFTVADSDFAALSKDFDKIVASFKFK
jgi:hypothetical protein